jgi:hypothetical protein
MNPRMLHIPRFSIAALAAVFSACSTPVGEPALRDKKSASVLRAMSTKLAAAGTLHFEATRSVYPGSQGGMSAPEHAQLSGVIKRPGSLRIDEHSSKGLRTVIYDGREIMFIDHQAGTYSRTAASPTLDAVCYWFSSRYGFTPPLAELLLNDPARFLLDGVTRGSHRGTKWVSGVECDHLTFGRPGLTSELWVGVNDSLPRQFVQCYTTDGKEARTVSATIHRWILNPRVPADRFKIRIPSGSQKVDLASLEPGLARS